MRKDSRLSFRISPLLNDRIEMAIEQSTGDIRDRSEFGTKAVEFYLDYLHSTVSENEIIINAVLKLANSFNVKLPEIEKLVQIKEKIEKRLPSAHPKYAEIIKIRDKLPKETKEEINSKLLSANYEDIDEIYEFTRERYFMKGKESPPFNIDTIKKRISY